MAGKPPQFLTLALAVVTWAIRERVFLSALIAKYAALPQAGNMTFDGDKVKALIVKYEPLVYELVRSGFNLPRAVMTLIARSFTPRKMTREEEEKWFDRASNGGQF